MKAERLNRWLTLGANLGVLAGIVLLVYELGQNREMMRAQTRNEVAVQLIDLMSHVSTNPAFASLLTRAASGEALTPAETTQMNHRYIAMFRYFENVHYQYRQGLYADSEFSTQQEAWRRFMDDRTWSFWCNYRSTVSREFRVAFDSLFTTRTC